MSRHMCSSHHIMIHSNANHNELILAAHTSITSPLSQDRAQSPSVGCWTLALSSDEVHLISVLDDVNVAAFVGLQRRDGFLGVTFGDEFARLQDLLSVGEQCALEVMVDVFLDNDVIFILL